MNEKIPALAYLEAQILHRASAQGILAPAVRDIEKEYGLQEGSLGGGIYLETRILSLLYSLIVVPKEFWGLGENHQIYGQIQKAWNLELVSISVNNSRWKSPIYCFIHHLRNSIAHANFQFNNGNFEFWDQYRNNPETYRAKLSIGAMQNFLEVVGSLLANLKN